jgi:hypothetical protein
LHSELFPPETFNLSFGAQSALIGVKIVLAAHTHPRAVFIESNVLRNSDTVFANEILRPWLLAARRWMISLRDFARPMTLVKTYLKIASIARGHFWSGTLQLTCNLQPRRPANVIFDQLLADQKGHHAAPLSKGAQASLTRELSVDIAALEERGIRVVFFEMPMNPALCEMPLQTSIRILIRTQFPAEPYFRIGDCNAVTTVDGLHLSWPEAEPVTRQFAEIIRRTIH